MNGLHIVVATTKFEDDAATPALRVNDTIGGAALAAWLASELKAAGFAVGATCAEDHGWDFDVTADGRTYLVVCSIEDDTPPPREAHVAITRSRSLWDRLKGTGKFTADDPVAAAAGDIAMRKFGSGKVELDWFD